MRKLRWGVLGTGKIISKAGLAIHNADNSEWIGIAGRNEDSSKEASMKYGLPPKYSQYQDLIDDPEIDAVYIALLNHLHKEWAIKALEAGKHVLLEKPFTLNKGEALEIMEAAKRSGAQIMEAHAWRHQEAYSAIHSILREGVIGEIGVMCGHFSFMAPPDSTRWIREWGGGALYDLGCYPIAWSRYYMQAEPEEVDCRLTFAKTGVDSRFVGTLYYPGNRVAHCSAALDMMNGSSFELYGTKGRMSVRSVIEPNSVTIIAEYGGHTQKWISDRVQAYISQVENFSAAILNNKPLSYSVEDAVQQMNISDALFKAHEEKRRIALS
ncbi:Gfo/Idh/MocA family protein [Paenibacillus senegalensis]|uniref:Gfo/Idh/MocA family protein n=1 Tax=Paenibacillus senegalensis TaxID=1465766 RepID=UPI00028A04E5|nr:Gfo/Idh/MocA family oxidoreductase [Paenibacillus senegalensis]